MRAPAAAEDAAGHNAGDMAAADMTAAQLGSSAPAIGDQALMNTAAADPSPVDPSPVDPSPVDPSPVDPSPIDASPVDASPAAPSSADPALSGGASGAAAPDQTADHTAAQTAPPPAEEPGPAFPTFRSRLRAHLRLWLQDHGAVRELYINLHKITPEAYRSAQPSPRHIRRFKRLGVKTVVNLRGGRDFDAFELEQDACRRHGIVLEELRLRSRAAPTLETIEAVAELLERIEYPVLFHCKSGADRAGIMSALYLLIRKGCSAKEAASALSLRYGHFRQSKTGVLDAVVEAFGAAETAAAARGETLDFLTWARTDYDAAALQAAFRSRSWSDLIVDGVLRRE